MNASGNFVVAWVRVNEVNSGVFARQFDATGTPLASEFKVADVSPIVGPSVAIDGAGNVVVAWTDYPTAVMARRYDGTGTPLGAAFPVSTSSIVGTITSPVIAGDATGNFVVAWMKPVGFSSGDIVARRFDGTGVRWGPSSR